MAIVHNANEVAEGLTSFPSVLMSERLHPALEAGGGVVKDAVGSRTPQDPKAESALEDGSLKSALEVEIDIYENGGMAKVGFGEKSWIANFCEYGHWEVGHPDKHIEGIQPAKPFMRPAADTSGDAAVEAFVDVLMAGFEKA